MIVLSLLMVCVVYLVGLVFSVVFISWLFCLFDFRKNGLGNFGVINVLCIGGCFLVVLVLFLDILKGIILVYFVYFMGIFLVVFGLIVIVVCLGYIYFFYFQFNGGKGVVIVFGVMLFIGFFLVGLLIVSWVVVVFIWGYLLLGVLVLVMLVLVFIWFIKFQYILFVVMLLILIIFCYCDNIKCFWVGEESKVWDKGKVNE